MHGQKIIVSFCSSNLLTSSVSQDFTETIIHFMLIDNNSVFLIAIEIQKESRNSEYRYIALKDLETISALSSGITAEHILHLDGKGRITTEVSGAMLCEIRSRRGPT